MRLYLFFIFILIFTLACEEEVTPINAEALYGYWLGGALKIDENNFRPINQLMGIKEDQITYLLPVRDDVLSTFSIEGDTIKMGSSKRLKDEFKRSRDILEVGKFHPNLYLKLAPVSLGMEVDEIQELLTSRFWKARDEILGFDKDSLVVFNNSTKSKQKMCWEVKDYEGFKFLVRKGSFANCDFPAHGIWHISFIDEERLEVVGWLNGDFKRINYKAEALKPAGFIYPKFQLCNSYISRNLPMDNYSFKYTNFEGGLYRLRQIFDKEFNPVALGKNSGIVKVGFFVNCQGEIGDFDIVEMDYDYKLTELNKEIQYQLINVLLNAGRWNPGQRNDMKVDTYKFLSFRIKDGRIIEIFP